ncbi:MAG: tyrosine-type recombinase/integrase [Pirellulales bacterium]
MANSIKTKKPAKPYPDFPLFAHATRRWAKKIRGKTHYFGPWADWQSALEKYQDQRDDLHAGRTPRVKTDGLTVREMCNRFMTAKEIQLDAGDIVRSTFTDYLATCKLIVDSFGKDRLIVDLAADDFEQLRACLAKTRNPNTLGNEVQRIRVAFKYGYDAGLIEHPVRFGPTFKRPAKRILRALRQKKGPRMYEADDLRRIIDAADQPLKAMIMLGVNCGFGNNDCGTLPMQALNLKTNWVDYPRPKTAVERRCPLWPETVELIQESIDNRPKAKLIEHTHLVFVTKYGQPWAKETSDNPISQEMRKLLDDLKLHRPGLGFYALRHTFETIAGESRDQVAVNHIMGHADSTMAGVYRERISDERLQDVSEFVRNWLFPPEEESEK